jgi:site-specific recombinase XerD
MADNDQEPGAGATEVDLVIAGAGRDQIEVRFDPGSAQSFVEKSLSEHTRRAYRLAVAEFFRHSGMKHPAAVTPSDVIAWRDELVRKKRQAATVAFKLSVVRSFFEHLRASGLVPLNPASTRLVSPPALPEGTAGRALTPREALMLLAGPDRRKADGARDHALMLAMLRLACASARLAACAPHRSGGATAAGP